MGLRELIARFTTDVDTKPLKDTDGLLDRLAGKSGVVGDAFKRLRGAIGGAAIVGGILGFARSFVAEAEQLQYTSQRLRTTTHDLQVMGAVGRSVGMDLNSTAGVMQTLRGKLDETARGLGDGGWTFRRLGVQVRDSNRQIRPLFEILGDTAKALSGVEREQRRLVLTDRLLGSEGRRIVDLYRQGGDALREYSELLEESGGGISQEAINAGLSLSRAWNRAGLSVDGLQSRLALFLLPKLEWLVRVSGRVITYINRTSFVTNTARAAMTALGVYGVAAIGRLVTSLNPLAIRFALATAAIAFTALAVDDLITLFSGGKSVIGGFLDEVFGVGTAATVVEYVKARFDDFLYAVRVVKDAVVELWEVFSPPSRTAIPNTATRTPIRRPTNTAAQTGAAAGIPSVVIPRSSLAGLGSIRAPAGADGTPGALATIPGAVPGRGGPLFGSIPGLRNGPTDFTVHNQPAFHLTLQNPTGNGEEIARQATPHFRRMMDNTNRDTVTALRDSGLLNRREPRE